MRSSILGCRLNALNVQGGRIIRLDELGQTFVIRLVTRLKYKDGHKTHYASGRTFLGSLEWRTTKGSSSGRIMRLVPVFILETHNPDELQNVCPSSSTWIMRSSYKNGHFLSSSSRTCYLIVRKGVLLQLYSEQILNETLGLQEGKARPWIPHVKFFQVELPHI